MSKYGNTFTSKFIVALLNTSGIALFRQREKLGVLLFILKYYLLISFMLTTFFQTALLKDCKTIQEVTLTIAYIFSGVFLNISTLILHFKKHHMLTILNMVYREIPSVMSQFTNTITADEKFRTFFYSHAIKFYIIYGLAIASPFLFFPISGNNLGDPNTLLIPSWFPWKINSASRYISTIGLQFCWLGPLSIPPVLNFTFVVYFVTEVSTQYDVLYADILKLKDHYEYDDEILANLKKSIRHYQMIMRFVGNFCSSYKWLFTVDLMYSLANLSLLLYGIMSGERTISAIMQQFSAFVLVFSFLFSFCYIGETLKNANERLESSLYDIEWFKQTIKFRKLFFVFMSIIKQQNINLKAGRSFIASYELFSAVLKLAYSYFNLLTTTFSSRV